MVRMGVAERRMLAALAEMDGLSEANVVRQLIRREHAKRSNEERKPKRPKR